MTEPFHPDLRARRMLPLRTVGPLSLRAVRALTRLLVRPSDDDVEVVPISDDVVVRVFRPRSGRRPAPALLWIHGGGMVIGTAAMDDGLCRWFADRLDIVVASVEYRLAPEHPFPTPLEDCDTALHWLTEQSDVDPSRIAIGGASAGGGLAAGLALLTRGRGEFAPVLQLLLYPMIDDRTAQRTDVDERRLRVWNQRSNRFGWRAYLGVASGAEVSPLAAPARAEDLSGLPPAWIGVGTNDLFHDEDVAYAERLRQAAVPCTLHVVPGAYHAFNSTEPQAPISRRFSQAQLDALDHALNGGLTHRTLDGRLP